MRVFLTILLFVLCGSSFALDQHKVDSLQNLLKTDMHDTAMVNTLLSLADIFSYQNPDTAIFYATKAKGIAEKTQDNRQLANALRELGWDNYVLCNYPEALNNYYASLKISEKLNDKKIISAISGSIGNVLSDQGDYPKALEYYFTALRISEELGNKDHIASWLGNIGIVYDDQGDYPNALEYYFKALKIAEEIGYKQLQANTLGNIGGVYNNPGNYPKALEYYFKALRISEELGKKNNIASWLGNIGIVYKDQGAVSAKSSEKAELLDKALEYFLKSLKIDETLGNKRGIAIRLGNIGSLYIDAGQYTEAEKHLLRALEIDTAIGYLLHEENTHEVLSDLYAQTNRYQLAYEHHKAYSIAKDSLFNEEKSKDLGKLEAKHEFEMVEMKRKAEEEERKRREGETVKRRNILQYSGIVIFIVLLLIIITLLGRFNLPVRLAEGVVFFTFLLFFEFTLVLLDPYIEQYSSGAPAIKLGFNALLAACIFPLHSFFEEKLKSRITKTK